MTNEATNASFATAIDRVGEHFLNVIYFDGGRYLIAAGVLTLFLFVCQTWATNRRIQRKRKASPKDYRREILSSGRTILVFAVTTLATLVGREMGIIKLKLDDPALFTIAWQFTLMVVVHDAYFYWLHRAMHTKRLFNATHLHHHKSRTPTPWTAYSFASTEAFLEAAFVPLFLLITSQFGIAYAGFAILFYLWHQIIRNVMAHAGSELFPAGWVDNPLTSWISTTTHHDLHHSSGHNYGFYFTWWDRMMGTEHPRYKEEFRKNAKPLIILPGRLAEHASSITIGALVSSIAIGGVVATTV